MTELLCILGIKFYIEDFETYKAVSKSRSARRKRHKRKTKNKKN